MNSDKQMPSVTCSFIKNIKWEHGTVMPVLKQSAHIWRISIPSSIPLMSRLQPLLSADEAARADSYYSEYDRNRFIISSAFLRKILARYIGQTAPGIKFSVDVNGKPHAVTGRNVSRECGR